MGKDGKVRKPPEPRQKSEPKPERPSTKKDSGVEEKADRGKVQEFTGTAAEALDHCWSLNRQRRHLDSSQKALASARRLKLSKEYGEAVEKMKTEAADKKSGKGTKRDGNRSATKRQRNEVRAQRAKEAGTNPKYIDAADKIEAERPDR
jgi:hypothetical protein